MSNSVQTSPLLDAIEAVLKAVWGVGGVFDVSKGEPRIPYQASDVPYAVIRAPGVDIRMRGPAASVANPAQENTFEILGRWPYPSDPSDLILDAKIARANEAIAGLQSGPNFAGIAIWPLVSHVSYEGADDPSESIYGIKLIFECTTVVAHH